MVPILILNIFVLLLSIIIHYLIHIKHKYISLEQHQLADSIKVNTTTNKPMQSAKKIDKSTSSRKYSRQMKLDYWLNPSKFHTEIPAAVQPQEPITPQANTELPTPTEIQTAIERQAPNTPQISTEIHISIESQAVIEISATNKTNILLNKIQKTSITPSIKSRKSVKKDPYSPILPYSSEGPHLNSLPYNFFDRFPSIHAVTQDMFCKDKLMKEEWKYYQEVKDFTGLFQHLLILNSFDYWDDVEAEIRHKGFSPKGFSVKEFVKWEFFRHSQGISHYEKAFETFSHYDRDLLSQAFSNPEHIPQPYHASYYYQWLTPAHFYNFFLMLVQECVQYKVIIPKILMADGLFERSAAGNFSLDKFLNPTDPDATRTVHNKKYLGKGFMAIVFCAWCGKRWLPVDVRVFTGSISENKCFKPTISDFLAKTPYKWKYILYDTGASSTENRDYIKGQCYISGITARSNIKKEEILELGPRRYGFWNDIPEGMSISQYKRLLEHRSQIEAVFSPFTTVFDMKRMNDMGLDAAMIHICKYLCLLLLHALTAYKVNADHLVMSAKAFTQLI